MRKSEVRIDTPYKYRCRKSEENTEGRRLWFLADSNFLKCWKPLCRRRAIALTVFFAAGNRRRSTADLRMVYESLTQYIPGVALQKSSALLDRYSPWHLRLKSVLHNCVLEVEKRSFEGHIKTRISPHIHFIEVGSRPLKKSAMFKLRAI